MTPDDEQDVLDGAFVEDLGRLIGLARHAVTAYEVHLPESLAWQPEMERLALILRQLSADVDTILLADLAASATDRERIERLASLLRGYVPPGRA